MAHVSACCTYAAVSTVNKHVNARPCQCALVHQCQQACERTSVSVCTRAAVSTSMSTHVRASVHSCSSVNKHVNARPRQCALVQQCQQACDRTHVRVSVHSWRACIFRLYPSAARVAAYHDGRFAPLCSKSVHHARCSGTNHACTACDWVCATRVCACTMHAMHA